MNEKIKGFLEFIAIIIIFIASSYLIGNNLSFFEKHIGDSYTGVIFFILGEIISIVVAPVTTMPFILLATKLFGWVNAGIYCLFAWSVGSILAFIIARKYGIDIVKKFVPLNKIYSIEKKIPQDHLFWSIVLLRIIFPMDILSYALGLFSKVSLRTYSLATIIGFAPLAFGLAYFGEVPFYEQLLIAILIILVISWTLYIRYFIKDYKRRKKLLDKY